MSRIPHFALTARLPLLAAALLAAAIPAFAHHSFAAEFDSKRQVRLMGTITRVDWSNPHAWIHLSVKSPNGAVTEWMIESGTPNTLVLRGFTKDCLKPGTEIVVDAFRARDGSSNAKGRDITLPDGRRLALGSPGTAAPFGEKAGEQ